MKYYNVVGERENNARSVLFNVLLAGIAQTAQTSAQVFLDELKNFVL